MNETLDKISSIIQYVNNITDISLPAGNRFHTCSLSDIVMFREKL